MDSVVIVSYKRTPLGSFQGSLSSLQATDLGSLAISETIKNTNIIPNQVYMGCVLQGGLKQAPARQAVIKSGLPNSVSASTINRVCGSGMQAIVCGYDAIISESSECVIAGGMESMSNAPYLLPKARHGYRLGHNRVLDHMFIDGLEDAYEEGKSMGLLAENTAEKYAFSRDEQDEFAKQSVEKAKLALSKGYLQDECVSVEVINSKKEKLIISADEIPNNIKIEKISSLQSAFKKNGTITAASSSSISDGAASIMMTNMNTAKKIGIKPIAKIVAHACYSGAPEWFATAPIEAINNVLKKSNWTLDDVDIFEINEAFAVVAMAAIKTHNIPPEKVNIFGGACALGHPIGASGTRIVVTLLHALKITKKKKGLATLCIGGGEGIALTIETID